MILKFYNNNYNNKNGNDKNNNGVIMKLIKNAKIIKLCVISLFFILTKIPKLSIPNYIDLFGHKKKKTK